MKLELYYAPLDANNDSHDIQKLEFRGIKRRLFFLMDKIIGYRPDIPRVFLLAIDRNDNDADSAIYVFESWNDIRFLNKIDNNWQVMHLHEFRSYEEAYDIALAMR